MEKGFTPFFCGGILRGSNTVITRTRQLKFFQASLTNYEWHRIFNCSSHGTNWWDSTAKRLSIHTILLSYVLVYTSGPFTTLDTRKCVRNVSYNIVSGIITGDEPVSYCGEWTFPSITNQNIQLLISQLFQGMLSKHTNNVQFHIQDWRRENLVIGRLTKTLSFNHFKSLYLSLPMVQNSLFMNQLTWISDKWAKNFSKMF